MGTWATKMHDEPIFTEAPEEVTRYFRQKISQPSFDWRDIAPIEHSTTFTVAKSAGFDVLDDIRKATDQAVSNQESFETFRQNLEPILREKGWWGKGVAEDPGGAPRLSQLGSLRRLRTIHWANVTTARAAGEWERIQRTKKFLPFLRYTQSSSEKRRPEHQSWVGTVLPIDHEWWQSHYPPNGWQCKCGVRQITRRQAESAGYDPDDDPPPLNERSWLNKRTGERVRVPAGIDPGWQTNPGLTRQRNAANFLGDRLAELPINKRRIAIADIMGSREFQHLMQNRETRGIIVPIAPVPEELRKMTGTNARHVFLSSDSAKHILDEHSDRGMTVEMFAAAMFVLADPEYINPRKDAAVFVGEADGNRWRMAVKVLATEVWITSFHRRSRKRR